jgi:hypothetical protein
MPSPIYQNMANLIVSLSIRRCPSKFMNVMMWDHRISANQIFGCGKVYSIIITPNLESSRGHYIAIICGSYK